jgi:dihydrofolate synthase/folylpolyglutamate synthase
VAREKAGVIKPSTPLLTGVKQKQVLQTFESLCTELEAPLYRLGRDIRCRKTSRGMHYTGLDIRLPHIDIPLNGTFQQRNAALALGALELLRRRGWSITEHDMREGIPQTRWPGRLHQVSERPRIILDGAHNPAAMRALCSSIARDLDFERLILVIGIMADKDARSMLKPLLPLADHVLFTRPRYERAMDPDVLRSCAPGEIASAETIPSLQSALDRAVSLCNDNDAILVCGSLFTIGEALSHLDPGHYPPEGI